MGTGAGKSLLFLLPSLLATGGVTILIVPLLSLLEDYEKRCKALRINYIKWNTDFPFNSAPIIITTPESAMTRRFQSLISSLIYSRRLDRIVIDEAYIILEGNLKFRPKLAELGNLGQARVQFIYLTATLPPTSEDRFF